MQVNISGSNKTSEQRSSKNKKIRQEREVLSEQVWTSSMEEIEEIMKTERVPKKQAVEKERMEVRVLITKDKKREVRKAPLQK